MTLFYVARIRPHVKLIVCLVVQFDSVGFTIRCNDFIVARIDHSYTFAVLSHIVLIYLHIVIYLIPTHFHPHRRIYGVLMLTILVATYTTIS